MRSYIAAIVFLLLSMLGACKKDVTPAQNTALTEPQVVQKVIGYYLVTENCSYNNGQGGFTNTTADSVAVIISTADDTTIMINGGPPMQFTGNLATHTDSFYRPASGGGYNAQFDSSCHNIMYGININGMAGGGCGGNGSK